MVNVEFTGGPEFSINADGRMEALLPTSPMTVRWQDAFRDALSSGEHAGRISAGDDAVTIVFESPRQFSGSMQATIEAIASANWTVRAVESTLRMLGLSEYAEQR